MRFSTIVLSTLAAALSVSAQDSTLTTSVLAGTTTAVVSATAQDGSATTSVVSGTAPMSPEQSTELSCLAQCPSNDNDCRAKCLPPAQATNGIASCISACPKGNGTATDNDNYRNCVTNCINTAQVTPTATPAASGTGGAVAATGSGSAASGAGASVASGTASAAASATSKASAADNVQVGASVLGVAGLFAAIFAL